jgi:type I restriction enzyme S subunit
MTWPMLPFEQLYAEPSRNGVYKSNEHHGDGTKIVNMGELFAYDIINGQDMKRLRMSETELEKAGLADGDLLFGRRSLVEAGAGKCSLVENLAEPTTFESSIIRVRVDADRVRPRFIFYWLKSPVGAGRIRAIVTGTNVKGIRGSVLKTIEVPCPPADIQDSIAGVLRSYDDLITNNTRRIKLLEDAARLLYEEWFVRLRFPGHEHTPVNDGVPEGWSKKPLDDLASIVMGQSPKSTYYNDVGDGLPFHQGVTDFGARFPTHRIYCTVQNRLAEPGDILFSVRAPVGRINIAPERLIVGRGLSAIRSKHDAQNWLFYALKSHFFKEDLIGGGAIFAAITKKDLYQVPLLCPTDRLVNQFMDFAVPLDRQIEVLQRATIQLQEARDLLLPRLMSGEVAV